MSKFVKYVMITAGAFLVLGIGLITAGRLMGGEPGFYIRRDGFFTNQDIKKERRGSWAVLDKLEVEAFESMDIQVDDNHIVVKPSGDGRYYLEYRLHTRKNEPKYSVENGVLTLTCVMDKNESSSSGIAGFFVIDGFEENEAGQATVYVPETASLDLVKLKSSDGKIEYDGPEAEILDLTSKYGGITLQNPIAENAYLTASDGNVTLSGGVFSNLLLTNKYGDSDLSGITSSKIDIKASDGRLSLSQITADSLTVENEYGDTDLDTLTVNSLTVKQSDGNLSVRHPEFGEARFDNEYGNIRLTLTGSETDYNYDLKMKYGEIKLNNSRYEEQDYYQNNGAKKSIATRSQDGNVEIEIR